MKSAKQSKTNIIAIAQKEASAIVNFWNKLVQPSREQLITSIKLQALGIGIVGLVGYVIKLVHIPINNILVNKPN